MKKAILLTLLAGGIILLYYGFGEYSSIEPDIVQFFNGSAADRPLGMMGGGVVATLIGAGGLLRRVKVAGNS